MSDVGSEVSENDALEALFVDEPDLRRLEALLQQFNVFEALGAVRVELRHSDFLAFLLSPSENHGLGDAFLKGFLQRAVGSKAGLGPSLSRIQLDVLDLEHTTVVREWENVDILVQDEDHRIVVAIENKVVSAESEGQLSRYRGAVERHFPSWTRVFLFLTPEGDPPSDDVWLPIDYGAIAALTEDIVELRAPDLGPDVVILLRHYAQMLRRHIVSESEIADICLRLYRKHKRALDMILEYRPDRQADIQQLLEQLVGEASELVLDHTSKTYTQFVPRRWDTETLRRGQGWTASGRMLMFEFANMPDGLRLKLTIGPGPESSRTRLFERAQHSPDVLRPAFKDLGKNWRTIWVRVFLTRKDCEELPLEEAEKKVRDVWGTFIERDLPTLLQVFANETWIWQA